jgi:hypothetical protein
MTTPPAASTPGPQEGAPELDEAFFLRVDRAMLARKLSDPYRTDEIRRAAEEEARLANMSNAYEPFLKQVRL